MSNIISDLYYGNLEPQALNSELSGQLKSKLNELVKAEERLESQLSPDAAKIFAEYRELYTEFMCLSSEDSFVSGVKIGAKLVFEMFN